MPNLSHQLGGDWDPRANNPSAASNFTQSDDKVDLGNWFAYGYRGKISLTRDWSTGTQCMDYLTYATVACQVPNASQFMNGNDHNLNADGDRSATTSKSWWRTTGDWLDTYQGNLGANMRDPINEYLAAHAQPDCPFSARWGKCVVMAVYMWEGGQYFDGTAWKAWKSTNSPPDRVHLVDFAYFAFYEGLPSSSSYIQGFFVAKAVGELPTNSFAPPSGFYNFYFGISE